MPSGYNINGVDLDTLLEPRLGRTPLAPATGFLVNGVDINDRYLNIAHGSAQSGPAIGIKANGIDLASIFSETVSLVTTTPIINVRTAPYDETLIPTLTFTVTFASLAARNAYFADGGLFILSLAHSGGTILNQHVQDIKQVLNTSIGTVTYGNMSATNTGNNTGNFPNSVLDPGGYADLTALQGTLVAQQVNEAYSSMFHTSVSSDTAIQFSLFARILPGPGIVDGTLTATITETRPTTSASPSYLITTNLSDGTIPAITLQHQRIISADITAGDYFGASVDISDDGLRMVVGAPGNGAHGAVYTYTRSVNTWTQVNKLIPPSPSAPEYFGSAIAISGNGEYLAVSSLSYAFMQNNIYPSSVGYNLTGGERRVVRVFIRSGNTWNIQATLSSSYGSFPSENLRNFGKSIAISNDGSIIAVGAPGQAESSNGANQYPCVFTFTRSGVTWSSGERVGVTFSHMIWLFGWSITLSSAGDKLIIGAPFRDNDLVQNGGSPTSEKRGAVFSAYNLGAGWILNTSPIIEGGVSNYTGWAVDMSGSGNVALCGRPIINGVGNAVRIEASGNNWNYVKTLYPSSESASNSNGYSTSVSGDGKVAMIAVLNSSGAFQHVDVHVAASEAIDWDDTPTYNLAPVSASNSYYGYDTVMSYNGSQMVVSAPLEDINGADSGGVYISSFF